MPPATFNDQDRRIMRLALALARRGYGSTSPNPMVGALLVKKGEIIGRGWHCRAGGHHAEVEAIAHAVKTGKDPRGSALYVTLEPCSSYGRTPPCTEAIASAGISRVMVGTTDPNPSHAGRAYRILEKSGIAVSTGLLAEESERLNESFNHWIVHRSPFVTVKAAMTLDGKIATAQGESKWITADKARAWSMNLRKGSDAILVGINTILADDPSLTFRITGIPKKSKTADQRILRRIILDSKARTPMESQVVSDSEARHTTLVVTKAAARRKIAALEKRVTVWTAPDREGKVDLKWLLRRLGGESVTSLVVEGGGEVNASFLEQGLVHRVAFFYAPKIFGGRGARKAVAGSGIRDAGKAVHLKSIEWRRIGVDILMTARVG